MGTNYYAIPQAEDVEKRRYKLLSDVANLDLSVSSVSRGFAVSIDTFDRNSPWDEFTDNIKIHLGKRSSGWKFLWNFHNNKYYSNKDELLTFIRKHRIIDEYGDEEGVEDFIKMALEWGQPDGWSFNEDYINTLREKGENHYSSFDYKYFDEVIDGLRVSSGTDFS
jgi:hypothetical protein